MVAPTITSLRRRRFPQSRQRPPGRWAFASTDYAIAAAQKGAAAEIPVLGILLLAAVGPTAGRYYIDISCGVPPKQFIRGEWFVTTAVLTGAVWVVCDAAGMLSLIHI